MVYSAVESRYFSWMASCVALVYPSMARFRKHRKYPSGALGAARRRSTLAELCTPPPAHHSYCFCFAPHHLSFAPHQLTFALHSPRGVERLKQDFKGKMMSSVDSSMLLEGSMFEIAPNVLSQRL